jgi:F420-dependent oxidoreductase-like protein
VRLSVFTEPQFGASYDDQIRIARHAEAAGFEAFFRSDHYLTMGQHHDGLPGPTDAWATLAGLARETRSIRLGTMVTSATFRLPGPLAITIAQVDAMSGGRVECGIGAGWYEAEHRAYGIPFPPVAERFERLGEQLEIITGLWRTSLGDTYSFRGVHYDVNDSPALPKPVQQPGPTVIVGGTGRKRTPALAARFADEFNVPFASLAVTAECYQRVAATSDAEGRAASGRAPLVLSAAQTVCCGRDEAEIRRRANAIGRPVDWLRGKGVCGTPDEVVETIGRFAEAGASRMHLQFVDMTDLDHLDLIASSVAPQLP